LEVRTELLAGADRRGETDTMADADAVLPTLAASR
jgi:hypothetical protein